MRRLPTVCSTPGCPNLTTRGRCDEHRKAERRRREADRERSYAYNDEHWRTYVSKPYCEAFPICIDCGQPSEVADHDPIDRAELVRMGDPDPDAWHHLKPRCKRCHNRRTAKQHGRDNLEAARLRNFT